MKRPLLRILAAALVMVTAASARAALIAWDNFETDTGPLNGATSGAGWTSDWSAAGFFTIVEINAGGSTPTLTYARGGAQVATGNRAVMMSNPGTTEVLDNVFNRTFANQQSTVYFSVVVRKTAGVLDNNTDFVQWGLTEDTDMDHSGSFGTSYTTNPVDYRIFSRLRSAGTNGESQAGGAVFEQDHTYLLVGKLWKSTDSPTANFDRFALYIDPDSPIESENDAVRAPDRNIGINGVTTLLGRIARIDANDVFLFDEIRIGTTFADVVPEPGAATLIALAGGALLVRRRRAPHAGRLNNALA